MAQYLIALCHFFHTIYLQGQHVYHFLFFTPKSSQQVYESTGQQVFGGMMRPKGPLGVCLGLLWVCLGQKGPIDGPKHPI